MATNPCDRLELATPERGPIPVLTVRQAAKCLVYLRRRRPRALAAFVLTCLAGLRPEEAQATTWSAVRLDAEPHVVVEAQTSKVRQRRIVYPMPAAVAWLRLAKAMGSELPLARQPWRRTIRDLRGLLGLDRWPQDVTRHTAASYWLAAVPRAAIEITIFWIKLLMLVNPFRWISSWTITLLEVPASPSSDT